MNHLNVIGVDLAKSVIQVCQLNKFNKMTSNKELSIKRFHQFIAKQPKSLIAFEACGRSHHWARTVQALGHEAVILPPQRVSPFRQGHKTDYNDAFAVAICASQPEIKPVGIMNLEQQSLQSDLRVQQHLSSQLQATGNMIRGLLAEFGIEINKGHSAFRKAMPEVLEENGQRLPIAARESIHISWQLWQDLEKQVKKMDRLLARRARQNPFCRSLMELEGVGEKNAIGLYAAIGDGRQFKNGRNAAACIGLTPKQHSSGGKKKIGRIGKHLGNQQLRSKAILGAHAVIMQLDKREPRNKKEEWLQRLIERRGKGRAAVALANKTVRTAWSMLRYNESYRAPEALMA